MTAIEGGTRSDSLPESITVTVKLFAAFQETCGMEAVCERFAPGTPVMATFDRLVRQYPILARWRSLTRYAINLEFVAPDTPLQDGDEVALIPPVSGG